MEIRQPNKDYTSDHTIVYSCQYHVIFCPKYRRKVLVSGVDVRLKELIMQKQEEYGYQVLDMEVMADHVHLWLSCPPTVASFQIVFRVKGRSSRKLRQEFPHLRRLSSLWTRSYFVGTAGTVSADTIRHSIEMQNQRA